jgi:hypothetical protein
VDLGLDVVFDQQLFQVGLGVLRIAGGEAFAVGLLDVPLVGFTSCV